MRPSLRLSLALTMALPMAAAPALHAQQTLDATPSTIVWGNYDPRHKPALTVHSGDTVVIHTLSTCGPPERMSAMGIPDSEIPQNVRDIYTQFPASDKGPGGHLLTGPVAIADAKLGDTLEIRIQKIDIDVPWACNSFGPGRGFLPDDFPYARTKLIRLDRTKMLAEFAPGVTIPLHPFFGSMGIATPNARTNSGPPWMNAGNMDNKELVAGTTLFLPVLSDGANFEVGDGHAGQGNGEVDITALETQLTGTFQFILHKGSVTDPNRLLWPRAETPTQYISMGFHEDLFRTTEMAIRNMITFLSTPDPDTTRARPVLSKEDAYALISTACDVDITQLVDMPRYGVHVMCPKILFVSRKK